MGNGITLKEAENWATVEMPSDERYSQSGIFYLEGESIDAVESQLQIAIKNERCPILRQNQVFLDFVLQVQRNQNNRPVILNWKDSKCSSNFIKLNDYYKYNLLVYRNRTNDGSMTYFRLSDIYSYFGLEHTPSYQGIFNIIDKFAIWILDREKKLYGQHYYRDVVVDFNTLTAILDEYESIPFVKKGWLGLGQSPHYRYLKHFIKTLQRPENQKIIFK